MAWLQFMRHSGKTCARPGDSMELPEADSSNTPIDQVLDCIAEGCAWIRLAVADADDGRGWAVRNLEVVTGDGPPSWELISDVRPGRELVDWLKTGRQERHWSISRLPRIYRDHHRLKSSGDRSVLSLIFDTGHYVVSGALLRR
jgi:hypothetical protein